MDRVLVLITKKFADHVYQLIKAPPTSPPYVDSNRGVFFACQCQYAVGDDGSRMREQGLQDEIEMSLADTRLAGFCIKLVRPTFPIFFAFRTAGLRGWLGFKRRCSKVSFACSGGDIAYRLTRGICKCSGNGITI